MPLPGTDSELTQRISTLERENRLLKIGVRQLTRIREQWTRSLDELTATKLRLQLTNQFLDQLVHTAPLPILVITRPYGRITMANIAAQALVGAGEQGLVGTRALRLLDRESRHEVLRSLAAATSRGPTIAATRVSLLTRQGELRQLDLHWADSGDLPGERDRVVVIAQDVSERLLVEQRLRFQSQHDPLTGLANRVRFRDQLELALAHGKRTRSKVGVMFLDLDGFKAVNDAYGHAAGDELLRQVASRLRSTARATDTIARFGGDEFAVIVPDVHELGNLEIIGRKILASICPPYDVNGTTCRVTVSIGVSVHPDDAREIDTLMKYADLAMYRVKAAGKNAYQFFTPEINLEAAKRLKLIAGMQRALDAGEFIVHFQPQVRLADRRIVGLEALARWQNPSDGMLLPSAFIGLAEETGMIQALGEQVLQQACRWAADWQRLEGTAISVSVNLSARQFQDQELPAMVRRVLGESGLDPACLVLEITESLAMDNLTTTERILHDLGQDGVRFALDEFGTGHASLACLKRLPFSQIKIDPRFIHDLETDACDTAIVDAIIRMAGALGLSVVAEGVETPGQLRQLEGLSCDQVQGYCFSRPLPPEDCRHLLAAPAFWVAPTRNAGDCDGASGA